MTWNFMLTNRNTYSRTTDLLSIFWLFLLDMSESSSDEPFIFPAKMYSDLATPRSTSTLAPT
ncbi:uncharacterized protein N7443_001442 [Penicillium atrosanguineum]|uniref:Uncharacterized protein n=1 Tax=Penicillium atrosanguineum TaxID=1132637 RepID=A0A9W9UDT9_9EURO|nr:uncharacterized protein N7443_001442 [Penicillium atrosanguineum]KAJ5314558.1 hypothetical protein N7443_001442 [Penicillium atrosanguineum]KAJ5331729.1 hypothetical protein N7476_001512 [Penicillium atrosanguineum]